MAELEAAGAQVLRRRARPAPRGGHAGIRGNAGLHVRHERDTRKDAPSPTETSSSRRSAALSALDAIFEREDSSTLLFLPLAHVFARLIQVAAVKAGVRLGSCARCQRRWRRTLGTFKPTFLLAVPRVFEKLFNDASQDARIEGRGGVFDRAVDTAIAYSKALEVGRAGPLLRARRALFDKLVYARLREPWAATAPWPSRAALPWENGSATSTEASGSRVLEGYGLTETTAAVTVNRPGNVRVGSVGQPLPGTTVRVADAGELLVRGGQVMRGYWRESRRRPEKCSSPDGWLHTGDLGAIDDEGSCGSPGARRTARHGRREERCPRHPWRSGSVPIPLSASAWSSGTADRSSAP